MEDQFLPGEYEIPVSAGNYMKFQKGDNRYRILTSPKLGWTWWTAPDGTVRGKNERVVKGDKPMRVPYDQDHPSIAKHCWGMVVWNYNAKCLQILEVTQSTVQGDIKTLHMNPKWGSPLKYDLISTRTGEGLETEYTTMPDGAPTPLDKDIQEAFAAVNIDLDKWVRGEEAFEQTPAQTKAKVEAAFPDKEPAKEVEAEDDLPFKK